MTERREALGVARAELDRLARDRDRILEFAGEGIYHVDERGRITYVNPGGQRAARLERRRSCSASRLTSCSTTRAPTARVDRFWRRDGTSFPVHYRSAPVPGSEGSGTVVVFSDESERELMERELRGGPRAGRARPPPGGRAERSRWARELHDETLQGLAGLHMLLASGRARAPLARCASACARLRSTSPTRWRSCAA